MKNFALERINGKINDNNTTQHNISIIADNGIHCLLLFFIIVIISSAIVILNRDTEIVNHDIIYN